MTGQVTFDARFVNLQSVQQLLNYANNVRHSKLSSSPIIFSETGMYVMRAIILCDEQVTLVINEDTKVSASKL